MRPGQGSTPGAAPSGAATRQPGGSREERPNLERRQGTSAEAGAGAGRGGNGENGNWQSLSPDERERMMRARGGRGANAGGREGRGSGGRGGRGGSQQPAAPALADRAGATTIDALFGPLPVVESRGRVWVFANKQLTPMNLRLGITDGQATELLEGELEPGMELVTNIITSGESTRPAGGGFPPFMGPGGRGPQGGNRGGGGGGGNRGGGGRGF